MNQAGVADDTPQNTAALCPYFPRHANVQQATLFMKPDTADQVVYSVDFLLKIHMKFLIKVHYLTIKPFNNVFR